MIHRRTARAVSLVLALVLLASLACSILPGSGGNIRLVNNLDVAVCYVYISPSTERTWGDDWLGSQEVVRPGDSRDFDVPPGQDYDLRAEDCNGQELDEVYGISITSGRFTWTLSPR
ncbi:MAG: hypothetical protein AB1449_13575 [Chloroflexota bacterium]